MKLNGERELGVSGGVLFASYTRVSKIPLYPPFEKGELFPKSHPSLKKHALSRVEGMGKGDLPESNPKQSPIKDESKTVRFVVAWFSYSLPAAGRRWRINPDTSPSSAAPFSKTVARRDRLWRAPWREVNCAAMNSYTQERGRKAGRSVSLSRDARRAGAGTAALQHFCSPCHDRAGTGQGMIVRRGYRAPASFHIDRLRQAPAGYFFDVISNGFGVMPDYAQQVQPEDRWAIVAYIRALQLSQHATLADVPEDQRQQLEIKP